jgi:hypothetical protein
MKLRPCLLPLILACALLAGCESLPGRLATTVPPKVQVVEGKSEQVYLAARETFKRLDFILTRSVMGTVEAASAIHTSETFGDSKQLVARVSIHEPEPGKCEVELWLTQEISSRSVGGTRREALSENGFFDRYFTVLLQVLQEQATGKSAGKN